MTVTFGSDTAIFCNCFSCVFFCFFSREQVEEFITHACQYSGPILHSTTNTSDNFFIPFHSIMPFL